MTAADGGAVFLHKSEGVTSFGALGALKRALGTKRVGHTGTLDRFATGLLIALVGRATKVAQFLSGLDKRYEAVVRFGEETETLDPEGAVVFTAPVPELHAIEAASERFRGEVSQRPPAYSAVHVGGERAYKLARKGVAVAVPERFVSIYQLSLGSYAPPDLAVSVWCSSGTYIRSLARDLGREAGSRAHLVSLQRSSVGPFHVEEAVAIEDFDSDRDVLSFEEFVPRIPGISLSTVSEAGRRTMETGGKVVASMLDNPEPPVIAAFSREGRFLCILDRVEYGYRYRFNRGQPL